MVQRYLNFADYNRWANARLYAAAARLSPDEFRADRGAFFGSVCGTLNHLLATDRIWLRRITGTGEAPDRLDAQLFESFADLAAARVADDARITDLAASLTSERLLAPITYANMTGAQFTQPLWTVLDHLFNHQTHHRGQVHTLLTILGGPEAGPTIDLIARQRETDIARPL
ncbi:DinB family protein [Ancylobacter sp. WKF20]|uniref:DinB family protein n=1 Tax=Ancylobacter sp. WKF20 TaxID=3039801 RepID=UPI0024343BB7|nr:DinB family protein [Ancylobacter sp. WKF20]WGD32292.1 DinB family protein [Ancylobacter sp. WKF20]